MCMFRQLQLDFSLSKKRGTPRMYFSSSFVFHINQLFRTWSGCCLYTVHLYADDTLMYTAASYINEALLNLQNAFNVIQHSLVRLKLVLNKKKSKYMIFSRPNSKTEDKVILTLDGTIIERVGS